MNFVLKLLKAKQRNEIRRGKLWKITRVWGIDVFRSEVKVAKPEPLNVKKQDYTIENVQVHNLKDLDDATNLTKRSDLI